MALFGPLFYPFGYTNFIFFTVFNLTSKLLLQRGWLHSIVAEATAENILHKGSSFHVVSFLAAMSVRSYVVLFFRNLGNLSNMTSKLYRGIIKWHTMFSDNERTIETTILLLSLSIQTVTRAYLFCQLHSITHRSFRVHSTLFPYILLKWLYAVTLRLTKTTFHLFQIKWRFHSEIPLSLNET